MPLINMGMSELKLDLMGTRRIRKRYNRASPYPHCIIDDLWPDEVLNEMIQEWPDSEDPTWRKVHNNKMIRNRNANPVTFPPSIQNAFSYMDSLEFREQLGELTGYENLIFDPSCNLGAGMHHDAEGAYLSVHSDALWNGRVSGYRVVNIFLYLNPEWKEGDGGELVLWDATTKTSTVTIPPLFNRTVIMETDEDSLHEVLPVNDIERKSLAFYYYVLDPPSGRKDTRVGLRWR